MQDSMSNMDAMAQLIQKLFAIQSSLPVIPKTSTNPHFKSKYADLPTIMEVLKPILAEHRVLLMQPIYTSENPNLLVIATSFSDADTGAEIRQVSTVPIGNNLTPQAFGSAVTYARRYILCSMLGIVADEDDDGNASSVGSSADGKISKQQIIDIVTMGKSKGLTKDDILAFLKTKGVHRLDALTQQQYTRFMSWLEKQKPKEVEA